MISSILGNLTFKKIRTFSEGKQKGRKSLDVGYLVLSKKSWVKIKKKKIFIYM